MKSNSYACTELLVLKCAHLVAILLALYVLPATPSCLAVSFELWARLSIQVNGSSAGVRHTCSLSTAMGSSVTAAAGAAFFFFLALPEVFFPFLGLPIAYVLRLLGKPEGHSVDGSLPACLPYIYSLPVCCFATQLERCYRAVLPSRVWQRCLFTYGELVVLDFLTGGKG